MLLGLRAEPWADYEVEVLVFPHLDEQLLGLVLSVGEFQVLVGAFRGHSLEQESESFLKYGNELY